MLTKDDHKNIIVALLAVFIIVLMGAGVAIPFKLPIFALLSIAVIFITLTKTDIALIILIFAMLLSPEIGFGGVPGREAVLRFDDVLIFLIFFSWLAKMAINKEIGLIKVTSLNRPILLYIVICIISSLVGVLRGTNIMGNSIFYLIKYFEYFLIFFMVTNNIRDKKQIKVFIVFMLITAFFVSMYALYHHQSTGMRATAPFEGEQGEPNTLAGYLILMIAVALGCFLYTNFPNAQMLLIVLMIPAALAFLFTLSRTGWLGMAGMYVTFLILSRRKKIFLFAVLTIVILAAPYIFPKNVKSRARTSFKGGETYSVLGRKITLDESASIRINTWKKSIEKWKQYPIIGYGVPGEGAISDVQYTRVLREVGLVGTFIFLWMIFLLLKNGWKCFRHPGLDNFEKGISLGYLCGLMGILIMGVGAEVFIIIRIMEPFWFMTAIITVLPGLENKQDNKEYA